jgi:hypothetical protein
MKNAWQRNPLNFALGAASVGFLIGLLVPVTVDLVRSSLAQI